jgi:hypothetical protein
MQNKYPTHIGNTNYNNNKRGGKKNEGKRGGGWEELNSIIVF